MRGTARRAAVACFLVAVAWTAVTVAGSASTVAVTGALVGELHSVDPVSATNVWAVGNQWPSSGNFLTLTEHRISGSWRKVGSPNPSSTLVSTFRGVEAITATDVWAVGTYNDRTTGTNKTLIEHWTGSSWKIVPSPNPGDFGNQLSAVSAVGANNVWAVGYWGKPNTLVLRWQGSGWKVQTVPDTSPFGEALTDVHARTASDVWAVGYHIPVATGGPETLVMRWDGSSWSAVADDEPDSVDSELLGVNAAGEDDVWAVGYTTTPEGDRPFAEHWDGSAWTETTVPAPSTDGALMDVEAVTPEDVWAVGSTGANPVKTFIVRWDGTAWSQVPSPSPVSGASVLLDVAARAANDVWAVGYYDTSAGHKLLVLHWDGDDWSIV